MPIYEYRCDDCGTKFEKLVRRAEDAASLVCPSCGEKHLKQELSTFAPRVSAGGARPFEAPPCASGCCNPAACGMNFNN